MVVSFLFVPYSFTNYVRTLLHFKITAHFRLYIDGNHCKHIRTLVIDGILKLIAALFTVGKLGGGILFSS